MKKNESISKIMSQDLTTVHVKDAVSTLRKIFEAGDIHHVPIVSGDKLVGIVSATDLMRISFGEYGNQSSESLDALLDNNYTMTDVMNSNVTSIDKSSTVRDAARALATGRFHALPVVDGEKLVGLVTSTDLLNYIIES